MYTCICNAIKESEVRESVRDGAHSVNAVYRDHDCAPVCGKCKNCIREIIEDELTPQEQLLAAE